MAAFIQRPGHFSIRIWHLRPLRLHEPPPHPRRCLCEKNAYHEKLPFFCCARQHFKKLKSSRRHYLRNTVPRDATREPRRKPTGNQQRAAEHQQRRVGCLRKHGSIFAEKRGLQTNPFSAEKKGPATLDICRRCASVLCAVHVTRYT